MAQITVTINGRAYPVACNEGEEAAHRASSARYIDAKVAGFARELGQIGEARLLVLAALVLADELADAQAQSDARHGRAMARPLDDGIRSPPASKVSPSASRRLPRGSKRPTYRARGWGCAVR